MSPLREPCMPILSIVIVNYNTRDPLRRTLESIFREQGDLTVEVVVVDNASKDESAGMVRAQFPSVIVVEPGRNTWFSGGNNIGVARATGEFALILNPDTVIQTGMLQTLLAYLQARPHIAGVTPQMRGLDYSLQRTCSQLPQYIDMILGYTFLGALFADWRNRRRAIMWYQDWDRDTTRAVEVAPGSCILARRDLLLSIGVFDENLRLYFTEDDLCKRLRDAGGELHFVSDAVILHQEHSSIQLVQRLASQIYFDDLLVFTRKWVSAPASALLGVLIAPTRVLMDIAQRLRGESRSV